MMFRRIFNLARVLRKCAKGNNKEEEAKEDEAVLGSTKDLFIPIIGVLVVVGLFFLTNHFSDYIEMFGGDDLLLTVTLLAVGICCVVLGFIELLNTLYMSSDLSALIVLPFSASEIVAARILNALSSKYLISAIILIPTLLGFGFATGADMEFYLFGLLGLILVPLFAIFAIAVIIILLMTFVRFFRNRDLISIFGVILVFLGILAYVYFMNGNNRSLSDMGNEVLVGMQGLMNFASIIPIVPPLMEFYHSGNGLFLAGAIVLVLITLILLAICVRAFYMRGAMAIQSSFSSKKVIEDLEAETKKNGVMGALMKKEFKTIFRTPAYYLNGWIITFLWPVLLVVPLALKMNFGEIIENLTGTSGEGLEAAFPMTTALMCLVSFSIAIIVSSLNNLAYNSISREGQSFFISKIIPISARTQIKAKRNVALIICLIGATVYTMIGALVLIFGMHLAPVWALIPIFTISVGTTWLMNSLNLWVGSNQVNLDWTDESVVGKQSSVILSVVGFLVGIFLPIGALFMINDIDPIMLTLGLLIIIVAGAIIFNSISVRRAAKRIEEL